MVLMLWLVVGVVAGVLVHLFYRVRGEQGYNVVGEALLGLLGAVLVGFTTGVVFGWRHIDPPTVLVALVGAFGVLGVSVYYTLQSSQNRLVAPEQTSRRSQAS